MKNAVEMEFKEQYEKSVEEKSIKKWLKEHKKELFIAGGSVAGICLARWLIKENMVDVEMGEFLKQNTSKRPMILETLPLTQVGESTNKAEEFSSIVEFGIASIKKSPHNVSEHIRNLPFGSNASVEKIMEASEKGIILAPGQTIVDAYRTGELA